MVCERLLVTAESGHNPCAGRGRNGHRLRLRAVSGADDEEGLSRVAIPNRLRKSAFVDVSNESEFERPITVRLQSFIRHGRAETMASNPQVHNIADAFVGVPPSFSNSNAVAELRHSVEDSVNIRYHVLTVNED